MLERSSLRRADLCSGSLISLLGLSAIAAALKMPMGGTYGGVDNPWYASPGAVPLLLGGLFFLGGLGVIAKAVKEGAPRGFGASCRVWLGDPKARSGLWRTLALWGSLGLYVALLAVKPFGFLGGYFARWVSVPGHAAFLAEPNGANYWVASALFLFGFVWLAQGERRIFAGGVKSLLLMALLLVAPLVVGYLFAVPLRVPLP